MKKLIPVAIIGAAIGAASYYFNANNKKHIAKTIDALDEISRTAEDTVAEFASEVAEDSDHHES